MGAHENKALMAVLYVLLDAKTLKIAETESGHNVKSFNRRYARAAGCARAGSERNNHEPERERNSLPAWRQLAVGMSF
jgi:hypothetical protein